MQEDELKEIFLAEALEQQEQLNRLFIDLEKDHLNKKAIEQIFRITHTLKANSAGMGFKDLSDMAHLMEDIFSELKHEKVEISDELFNDLFRANDVLGAMIHHVKDEKSAKPKFRGIKTKLEVFLRNLRKKEEELPEIKSPESITIFGQPEIKTPEEKTEKKSNEKEAPVEMKAVAEERELVAESLSPDKITFSDRIHIPIRKLDDLLNLVGELIIEKDRVINIGMSQAKVQRNDYVRLQRITSELQYAVMDIRLVQIGILFSKFHRISRDVASAEGKQVSLVLEGVEIEIDRTILQIMSDSLVHLVRNAISHGIETEDRRINNKKPARGTVTLSAESIKEEVVISVSDDGKGIDVDQIRKKAVEKNFIDAQDADKLEDETILQLIFESGFSSAETVTDISGRGVGMDVVKRAVDSVGGKIYIETEKNKGTKITLTLPSSMAVKGALLFELASITYAIPLSYTNAVTSLYKRQIHKVNNGLVANYLDKSISIVFLNDLFKLRGLQHIDDDVLYQTFDALSDGKKLDVIIVNYNNREIGLVVDKLFQQKEIVEKPLGVLLKQAHFVSGATILGNGEVCLVLDAPSLMNILFRNYKINR